VAYPDVDALLVGWLPDHVTATTFTTDDVLPTNLAYALPLVQVVTFAGADLVPTLDESLVDVDCYAAGRDAAKTLAEQVRTAIRTLLLGTVDGVVVAKTRTSLRPARRPYDNTAIRRIGATYGITVHASP
jgi:hypothetical protein